MAQLAHGKNKNYLKQSAFHRYIDTIAIVFLSLLSMNSHAIVSSQCEENLPITQQALYGSWKYTQGQVVGYFTFNSDMTFGGRVEESGIAIWKYRGTWSFKNNAIDYRYTFSSSDQIKVGTRDHDEILEIGCDQIKIKSMMGRVGFLQKNDGT
ncbi:MAG: hypothetical protein GY814_19565 [Gammaproteobacteria bacterium]|nr:hypothetical protein [Gammaproteobacteria bacterium]